MLKTILLKLREKFSLKNIKDFKFKKYTKLFSVLAILIIVGLVLPSGIAHAYGLGDLFMEQVVFRVIYVIFSVLLGLAWVITWIAAYTLDATLNPAIMNNVFNSTAIQSSWSLIRDICNLLFLLLLLLVAFGTIVQSQKYNIKNSLPKLLLAIFLINFSNVVAGAIIDFGNILMYGILQFMCALPGQCFHSSMSGLMQVADDFANNYNLAKAASLTGVSFQDAVGAAVAMIYVFMYAFILLALAAFIIIRTAGLAILLILAPFAYFGEVMPGMEKIASKWWNNIWSYALFGPIFALMLYIAAQLAQITINVPPISDPNLGWYGAMIVIIIRNAIPLVFLLSIIPITKELGLAGTDTIMKNTTGVGSSILTGTAKYMGNAADRFAARGAKDTRKDFLGKYRRGLSNLSPTAWKRAAKNMTAEQDHDFDIAAGSHWNKLNKPLGGKPEVDRKQIAIDREVTRVMSTLSDSIASLSKTYKEAKDKKDAILTEASFRKLGKTGDVSVGLSADGKKTSQMGFNNTMQEMKEIMGKERAEMMAEDVGLLEDADGNTGFVGWRAYNKAKGTSRLRNTNDIGNYYDEDDNMITSTAYGALSPVDQKKWKIDAGWQQNAVNEKLAKKSSYTRNVKLKSATFEEYELDVHGKETNNKRMNGAGIDYYNTIGAENVNQTKKLQKKQAVEQIKLLYKLAESGHAGTRSDPYGQPPPFGTMAGYGLTPEEKDHLKEMEDKFGQQDARPLYLP